MLFMQSALQVKRKRLFVQRFVSLPSLLLTFFLVTSLLSARYKPYRMNVLSRLALTQALVEQGRLTIDSVPYTPELIDKVFARGHFYSDKPPTLSLLAAAIYYPLYHLGHRLWIRASLSYVLIVVLLMGLSTMLCLIAFYHALAFTGAGETTRLLMTAGLAFATLLLPWSTTLNNHSFSASWTFIGFYFLLRARLLESGNRHRSLLLAGASVGLAAAADSACVLFAAGFALYILLSKELRPAIFWYAAAAFLIVLPGLVINYTITGDLRPAAAHGELFLYPGSYWIGSSEHLSGISRNSLGFALRYGWLCLFGRNGFLLYDPLLLIALYQGIRLIAARRSFWREALLVIALASIFVGYFSLYTSNYGGFSYSVRWFVTLIPLLWFFSYPFFKQWNRAKAWTYGGLFAVSFLIAIVGAYNPWPATLTSTKPAFVLNWQEVVTDQAGK